MRRIPSGMFIPGTSALHRLDPRVKLPALLMLIAAVIATETIAGYAIIVASIALIVMGSKLPTAAVFSGAYRLRWFFLLIFLMNTCFFSSADAWFVFWIFNPSMVGATHGATVVFRAAVSVLLANTMTVSTSPGDITYALERLMAPLRYVKIPTDQASLIISAAISFIPVLSQEAETIRMAQTARGAKFDSPKLCEKAVSVIPLVLPIFIAAFRRADDLAAAMEARGYRSKCYRRQKRRAKLRYSDWAALLGAAALLGLQAALL